MQCLKTKRLTLHPLEFFVNQDVNFPGVALIFFFNSSSKYLKSEELFYAVVKSSVSLLEAL